MIFLKQLRVHLKISTKYLHMVTRYKTVNSNAIHMKFNEFGSLKLKFPYQNIHRNYNINIYKEDEADSDTEDIENKRDIKNIVLPNSEDSLALQISECKSLQQIFDLLQNNNNQLNWENISMAIAMIRELQIIYYRVCMYDKNLNFSNNIPMDNFENILTNNSFLNLLNVMEKHYNSMNLQCLSYSILCLHKIGIDINSTIYQKLTLRLKELLLKTPVEQIQSNILSRFTVCVVNHRNLSGLYILKDIWPKILKRLSK